jgi:parallel beta-helix repeat protein
MGFSECSLSTPSNVVVHNCTITDWTEAGINVEDASGNRLYNNTLMGNSYDGIALRSAPNNLIYDNWMVDNEYAISLYDNTTTGNYIYNNFLNNTYNTWVDEDVLNNWNVAPQGGIRIYSNGSQIGGNYHIGYSDSCLDINQDGFCDEPYDLWNDSTCTVGVDCSNNVDYYPLSENYTAPPMSTCPPTSYFAGLVVIFVFLSVAVGVMTAFGALTPEILVLIGVPAAMAAVWLLARAITCGGILP